MPSTSKNSRGIIQIIVIIGVLILGIAAFGGAYLLSQRETVSPQTSGASGGRSLVTPVPIPQLPASPLPTLAPALTQEPEFEEGTTATGWKYSGYRDVIVTPSASADKKYLYLDFESENFSEVASISYTLLYKASGLSQSAKATFAPSGTQKIRKEIFLGVCSSGVCTAYTSPANFELTVQSTRDDSEVVYEQTLTKTSL